MNEAMALKAVKPLLGGTQRIYGFDNGYGASVVSHTGSYGGGQGLWEVAVTDGPTGRLVYDTPVTDDVIGYLHSEEVGEVLAQIAALPARRVS